MILGTALILAALSLFIWNQQEGIKAGDSTDRILPQVLEQIEKMNDADGVEDEPDYPDPYSLTMTETEIDGYTYVGYLSIPSIELELPVMSDWDYARLKISPCRYAGSTKSGDLVICAHNYTRHFGPIRNLVPDDLVFFNDMDGMTWQYKVVAVDILSPTDIENMTAGDYDLTLFTCTYGGQSRVAVRCEYAGSNLIFKQG